MCNYTVVVPVFRGHNTIYDLFKQLQRFFSLRNESFELIFVFDNGLPESWTAIEHLVSKHKGIVKGIKLSRNFGQHNATICGFEHAAGNMIITMDEDLQHDANDIALLISTQQLADYDLVYGQISLQNSSSFRRITSLWLKKLLRLGMPDLHPHYSSFRLLKAQVARHTCSMKNSYTFLDGYLTWITSHVASVKVSHGESKAGESAYSFKKLVTHAINIFITFSFVPIRIVTALSFIVFILSSGYALYTLFRKLIYNDFVSGFATFAIMGGLGLAAILFSLGVIGEYILRINLKTTQRPNYIVKQTIE